MPRDTENATKLEVMEAGGFVCPFCNASYTPDMLRAIDTYCGEGTCEMMYLVIRCENCKRAVYAGTGYGDIFSWGHREDHDWRADVQDSDIAEILSHPIEDDNWDDWSEDRFMELVAKGIWPSWAHVKTKDAE